MVAPCSGRHVVVHAANREAEQTGAQAQAAATAYEPVFAMMMPSAEIAVNWRQAAARARTNIWVKHFGDRGHEALATVGRGRKMRP